MLTIVVFGVVTVRLLGDIDIADGFEFLMFAGASVTISFIGLVSAHFGPRAMQRANLDRLTMSAVVVVVFVVYVMGIAIWPAGLAILAAMMWSRMRRLIGRSLGRFGGWGVLLAPVGPLAVVVNLGLSWDVWDLDSSDAAGRDRLLVLVVAVCGSVAIASVWQRTLAVDQLAAIRGSGGYLGRWLSTNSESTPSGSPVSPLSEVFDLVNDVPAARFASLNEPLLTHAVIVGRRVALVGMFEWPKGRYSTLGWEGDVMLNGRPFPLGGQQMVGVQQVAASWSRLLRPARVMAFVIIPTALDDQGPSIPSRVRSGFITYCTLRTAPAVLKEFLAKSPYLISGPVVCRVVRCITDERPERLCGEGNSGHD